MRTVIYTRLSEDRDGEQTATARQEADCRAYAEEHGWIISAVYTDRDSAFDKTVVRSDFEDMLLAIQTGLVGRVLVWKMDRLVRQPRDLERILDALETAGGALASVNDPVDVSGPMGLAMLRIGVVMAHTESANTSLRVRRKMAELAKEGKVSGGGRRPFGYTYMREAVIPEEATLVREAAERVLHGEAANGIARDWAERGIKTSAGGEWTHSTITRMLRNPAIAGLRQHNGTVVAKAVWPPILSEEQHAQITSVLDPARRRTTGAGNVRTHVLAGGILRCGRCGAAMVARPRDDKVRRYVCAKGPGLPGCGGTYILAEPLEELVFEAVVEYIDTPEFTKLVAATLKPVADVPELVAAIHADEASLEDLSRDFYVDKLIDRASFLAAQEGLHHQIASRRERLSRLTGNNVLAGLPTGGEALRRAWAERDISWRQSLLGAVLESVQIGPGVRGRTWFDPERVSLVWRG